MRPSVRDRLGVPVGAWASAILLVSGCAGKQEAPYTGFVDAPVSAVASQVAGKVASIPVREGDHVRKGDLLAALDALDREAAIAVAEANVNRGQRELEQVQANLRTAFPAVKGAVAQIDRAQATLDEAQQTFDRVQYLVKRNSAPIAELDAARARLFEARASVEALTASKTETQGRLSAALAAVSTARAAVRSAQATLEVARVELAETRVRSPFDGVVVARNLEEGEWAAPGSPVVTVEESGRPWVRLDVEETEFGRLSLGEAAELHVFALPGRTFEGRVSQIGAEGDFAINRDVKRGRPDVRTFLVRVSFDAPPDELRPGMTAEVRLSGAKAKPIPAFQATQ